MYFFVAVRSVALNSECLQLLRSQTRKYCTTGCTDLSRRMPMLNLKHKKRPLGSFIAEEKNILGPL